MRPVVMFRKSHNDLLTVVGNVVDKAQHVFRIDFSTPCLGCDSTNGECVLGIYCQCNNPKSSAGNCSVSCDCVHGECFPRQGSNPLGICVCERGWFGDRCDQRLECEHGTLMPRNSSEPLGRQDCNCHSPYFGTACNRSTSMIIQYFSCILLRFCYFPFIFVFSSFFFLAFASARHLILLSHLQLA
jgi:hypothetical protein